MNPSLYIPNMSIFFWLSLRKSWQLSRKLFLFTRLHREKAVNHIDNNLRGLLDIHLTQVQYSQEEIQAMLEYPSLISLPNFHLKNKALLSSLVDQLAATAG